MAASQSSTLVVDSVSVSRRSVSEGDFVTVTTVVRCTSTVQSYQGTVELTDRDNELLAATDVAVPAQDSRIIENSLRMAKTGDRRICAQVVDQAPRGGRP
jgi:hypothetical protein